jgi:hypothetical protein
MEARWCKCNGDAEHLSPFGCAHIHEGSAVDPPSVVPVIPFRVEHTPHTTTSPVVAYQEALDCGDLASLVCECGDLLTIEDVGRCRQCVLEGVVSSPVTDTCFACGLSLFRGETLLCSECDDNGRYVASHIRCRGCGDFLSLTERDSNLTICGSCTAERLYPDPVCDTCGDRIWRDECLGLGALMCKACTDILTHVYEVMEDVENTCEVVTIGLNLGLSVREVSVSA